MASKLFSTGLKATWQIASTTQTPAAAYAAWAASLSVSSTTSLYSIDGDDDAFPIELQEPLIDSWTDKAFYASEGAVGFYTAEPSDFSTESQYTITNVSRMYGLDSRPLLLFSFHSPADLGSSDGKIQKAGTTTIIYAKHHLYNDTGANRSEVAIKITPQGMDVIGYVQDTATALYFTQLTEDADSDTIVSQTLISNQAVGSRYSLSVDFEQFDTVNIDGYVQDVGLLATAKAFAINNFTEQVRDSVSYFKLEAKDVLGGQDAFTEVPMQYFRGTIWSYRPFLPFGGIGTNEVFIPSGSQYAENINDAQFFRVKRFFKLPDGTEYEQVWFKVASYAYSDGTQLPMTKEFTSGATQDFCIVKGVLPYFEDLSETALDPIVLTGIRSVTSGANGKKVICNLDPVLKPGMMVQVGDDEFAALTMSIFVSPSDQYMEVYDYHV